jgi:hypothetical protein
LEIQPRCKLSGATQPDSRQAAVATANVAVWD